MKNWKHPLIESLLLGSGLALILIFFARQQMGLDWLRPAFHFPFQGAVLLSGNAHEPPPWLFHAVLFLQCYLAVLVVGWLVGRYRGRSAQA